MKKIFLFLSCSFFWISSQAQKANDLALIPEPVSLVKKAGSFVLPKQIGIEGGKDHQLSLETLKKYLSTATGYSVSVNAKLPAAAIRLIQNNSVDNRLGDEGYQLTVSSANITVRANTSAGMFYGVQSLLQLFPKEIKSNTFRPGIKWEIPAVEITDFPRFKWRGLMFDVARHFFTKEEVKQYIDEMVQFKFNILHLHLTDDEGWRIQIKGLPKLTEVGAWNVKKEGYFGTFSPPAAGEPRNFGGFFTQDDIRELVAYAKQRYVNILPEIDVPGHSLAAVVSYPELSCTPEANKYVVRSGEPIMDWSRGAPPIALVDNTLCPANEKVYTFLDQVITQVAELFPFEYIHMGGDECPKNFWEKSSAIKELMQKEGLKTMQEVQSYFTKRVQKIVASKGKKLIGWDEIIEGGLAPNTAVMNWRGTKYGVEASKMGHEVVMSPTTFAYLDYMQADPAIEPRIYASLRLKKAYQFDPVPEGADPKFIKGGQANLWTEQVYNMRHAQYMTWPRGWAIAESLWSPKSKKDWNAFFKKVEHHFERNDIAEVKYARAAYDPIIKVSNGVDKKLNIELSTEVEDITIHYSFDNSFPDHFYPKYTAALTPPKDAVMLRLITYRGKQPVGRMMSIPIEELQKRADKKLNYQ